jgi:hypothetical protein
MAERKEWEEIVLYCNYDLVTGEIKTGKSERKKIKSSVRGLQNLRKVSLRKKEEEKEERETQKRRRKSRLISEVKEGK